MPDENKEFPKQYKKQLQALMSDARWGAVEAFIEQYIRENFIASTIKRDTDFNTIWHAAESEGGKMHIRRLLAMMERVAREADEV